jgi:hypothetical protein
LHAAVEIPTFAGMSEIVALDITQRIETVTDDSFVTTFDRIAAKLSREYRSLETRIEPLRIRWLADVAFGLWDLVRVDEDRFRTICQRRSIARHGRSEIMLLRYLVHPDDLNDNTAKRWADAMLYGFEHSENPDQMVKEIQRVRGLVGAQTAYIKEHPERAQSHRLTVDGGYILARRISLRFRSLPVSETKLRRPDN